MVALDARTGKLVWKVAMSTKRHSQTGGVMVIHGKVMVGLTGCSSYATEKCAIIAYDANTGAECWRFFTIALRGPQEVTRGTDWMISIAQAAKPGSPARTIRNSISPIGA